MSISDTIVALSTPGGQGAIGVIRLSGPQAIGIAGGHFSKPLADMAANTVRFGTFGASGAVLDECVLTLFRAPYSYTGEDVIELSFHGSPYILSSALEALLNSGARLAEPGEFTQRAFLNGKLDLSQAEAVADLIASESTAEHRLAMHQMRGGFSREIERLREELIHFASLIELELDFSEEDVEFANREQLKELINRIRTFVQELVASFRYGNAVKNGVPVAIVGKPNAGKSTLLNALLKDDRAIVSEIAGTTRDAIEDEMVIEGIRFRFIDTAGIRDTTDTIEAMGVQRSFEKMRKAAIVIYLYDVNEISSAELEATTARLKNELQDKETLLLAVGNKADIAVSGGPHTNGALFISAKSGLGLDSLQQQLVAFIQGGGMRIGEVVVTNTRHLQALQATDRALQQALGGMESGLSGDLVAADIREALHYLGSITGQITTDDLLGNIFGKFCIGK